MSSASPWLAALKSYKRTEATGNDEDAYLKERRERKRPKKGRPVKVGSGYQERWKVERTFAWLGNFRRLLVRHERHLCTFRAFFLVAFILVSLRQF